MRQILIDKQNFLIHKCTYWQRFKFFTVFTLKVCLKTFKNIYAGSFKESMSGQIKICQWFPEAGIMYLSTDSGLVSSSSSFNDTYFSFSFMYSADSTRYSQAVTHFI